MNLHQVLGQFGHRQVPRLSNRNMAKNCPTSTEGGGSEQVPLGALIFQAFVSLPARALSYSLETNIGSRHCYVPEILSRYGRRNTQQR